MVRYFLDEWSAVQKEIQLSMQKSERHAKSAENPVEGEERYRPWRFECITLATGSLFAATLRQAANEFNQLTGLPVTVQGVVNKRLGETITVAGLLMGNDILSHLESHEYGDLVVLPQVMFDHPDTITLDDISPQEIANKLSCPVALADTMGDVWDALIGTSEVIYNPETRSSYVDSSAKQ